MDNVKCAFHVTYDVYPMLEDYTVRENGIYAVQIIQVLKMLEFCKCVENNVWYALPIF